MQEGSGDEFASTTKSQSTKSNVSDHNFGWMQIREHIVVFLVQFADALGIFLGELDAWINFQNTDAQS